MTSQPTAPFTPFYALASGLRGFGSVERGPVTELRVLVTRVEGEYVWVRTADLFDAGTPLVLSPSQITPFSDYEAVEMVRHQDGLVYFG